MKEIYRCIKVILAALIFILAFGLAENNSYADTEFKIEKGVLIKYQGNSTDVVVPDTVKKIGANAFAGNKYIRTVVLPESVKVISNAAFYDCWRLRKVSMLGNVTSIGKFAFCGCESLTSINLPDSIKTIGEDAFVGCAFQTISLPASLTSIQTEVFLNCSRLKSIVVTPKVTSIGVSAFEGCENLQKIFIPLSVTKISVAFPYYKGTLQIYYEGSLADWKKINVVKSAKVWDSSVSNKVINKASIYIDVTAKNPFLDLSDLKDTPIFKYIFANRIL